MEEAGNQENMRGGYGGEKSRKIKKRTERGKYWVTKKKNRGVRLVDVEANSNNTQKIIAHGA